MSLLVSRVYRIKLEPINPAPPVTTIFIGLSPESCCYYPSVGFSRLPRRCRSQPQFLREQRFLAHHLRGPPKRFERSRIRPPAVDNFVTELSFDNIRIVDVSDFELPAPRRPQRTHSVEHRCIVEIHADDRVGRAGNLGLFLDANNSLTIEHRNPEALRIRHTFQKNHGTFRLNFHLLSHC